jgi:hypothetical protein
MAPRKGNRFVPETFEGYKDCPYKHLKNIAGVLAKATDGITAKNLRLAAKVGSTTAQAALDEMRELKFVYISKWASMTPGPKVAVYKVGNLPDARAPAIKAVNKIAEARRYHRVVVATENEQVMSAHCAILAKALVPKRSGKKQREVNWQYLNWISGGVYA